MSVYSIRGSVRMINENAIMSIERMLQPWTYIEERLTALDHTVIFMFEVWVSNEDDKNLLFEQLKPLVSPNDWIDWHMCSHDDEVPQPCVIIETYRGE